MEEGGVLFPISAVLHACVCVRSGRVQSASFTFYYRLQTNCMSVSITTLNIQKQRLSEAHVKSYYIRSLNFRSFVDLLFAVKVLSEQ